MPITSVPGLVDALRAHHVLDAAQLDEVTHTLAARLPEPRALAGELLRRGWLTPFQVNHLLQGRGGELVLGPYLLLERLGEGGMGQVFKARHQLMNRVVALKVIRKERLAHGDAVQRFHREIRMAAQLDHPHLVRAHDAAQVGETHFLVMEYAEGTDLQRLVRKSGPLPVGLACAYARQAALGLQHASERGLVHRDIKPSNLQVTAQGAAVKILDMGLARWQVPDGGEGTGAELTQDRTVLGTPDYIAPEQIDDPRRVDVRADIYSLGCALYFMLAGRPPFPAGSWEEKLLSHRKAVPQPVEQVRPEVHPALAAILRKMMAKRPEDRYSTPVAVADALAPFCQIGVSVPTAAGPAPAAGPLPTTIAAPASGALPSGAAGPERGWTLETGSTVCPPAAPPTPAVVPAPHPAGGQPISASTGRPMLPAWKRPWLIGAVGGGVCLLIVLLILLWPRGGAAERKPDEPRTQITDGGGDKGKAKEKENGPLKGMDETFQETLKNGQALPAGWTSNKFSVVPDKSGRACLEVNAAPGTGLHLVKVPPVTLKGNFYVEGEYLISGNGYLLSLRLEGRKGETGPLEVTIDGRGHVTIPGMRPRPPENYQPWKNTVFRLTRQGKTLRVLLNGEPAVVKGLENVAEYDTLYVGLTSGGYARLYSLKISPLGP